MKKIFGVLLLLLTLTFGIYYLKNRSTHSESLHQGLHQKRIFPSHKRGQIPKKVENKKVHHHHNHDHGKRFPSAISPQKITPTKENKRLQKKYNSQIKAFKKNFTLKLDNLG